MQWCAPDGVNREPSLPLVSMRTSDHVFRSMQFLGNLPVAMCPMEITTKTLTAFCEFYEMFTLVISTQFNYVIEWQ